MLKPRRRCRVTEINYEVNDQNLLKNLRKWEMRLSLNDNLEFPNEYFLNDRNGRDANGGGQGGGDNRSNP